MKKLFTLLALCLALLAAFGLAACTQKPSPSTTPSVGGGSVEPIPMGEILSVTDTQIVISVNEVEEGTTLIAVMAELKANNALSYEIANGMITSLNGKTTAANEFWGLYTSDAELSNTEWGTAEYEGKTYGSAMFGAETMPVISNGIYIWKLSSF